MSKADSDPSCATGCQATRCPLRDIVPLLARMLLGGLLFYAGWLKLGLSSFGGTLPTIDAQTFAFSIKKFDLPGIGADETIIGYLVYVIPWTEMFAGALLVVGLWTRAAALVLTLLVGAFTAGIIGVVARGMDVSCSCFGKMNFVCPPTIGMCHVGRNAVLMGLGVIVLAMGPGWASIDGLMACCRKGGGKGQPTG